MSTESPGHYKNKRGPIVISRRSFIQTSIAATGLAAINCQSKSPVIKKQDRDICLFSKHLQWLNYEEMAATVSEIGFDGVDLTVRPGGHVLSENIQSDLPKAVSAIKKAGLKVPMMTTRITSSQDHDTEKILDTAAQLGMTHYRMGYLKYDHKLSIPQNLDIYRRSIEKLARLNEKYKIHGAYQNHDGSNVGSAVWDLWLLFKDLDPQWIGCQYDVRHATVEGGHSWQLAMRLLAEYIQSTVIKDCVWLNNKGKWNDQSVPLGEGMVDWDLYFKLLSELDISGPISLHYEYPVYDSLLKGSRKEQTIQNMQRDLKWLREKIKGLT